MIINGLSIPVFVRIRRDVSPHGGRRVEVTRIDGDMLQVDIRGRDAPAWYRRSEVTALDGGDLLTVAEVTSERPWSRVMPSAVTSD